MYRVVREGKYYAVALNGHIVVHECTRREAERYAELFNREILKRRAA
jgi:hypothetical protein